MAGLHVNGPTPPSTATPLGALIAGLLSAVIILGVPVTLIAGAVYAFLKFY